MKTTDIPDQRCPECKAELCSITDVTGDQAPPAGCVLVCLECAHALVLDSDMTVRVLDEHDVDDMPVPLLQELRHYQEGVRLILEGQRIVHKRGGWRGKL